MKFPLLAALAMAGLAAPLNGQAPAQPPEDGAPPEAGPRGRGGPNWRGGAGRMLPATRAEAEQMAAERFQARDANRDGFLSADELGPRGAMLLERQDADRDGKISAAEATGGALAMFDRADTDRDGRIGDAERQAAMAAFGGPPRPRGGERAPFPSTRAEIQRLAAQLFAAQDADRDGFLTSAELGAGAEVALRRLDANRDGKLTAAENGEGLLALFDRVDTDRNGTISPAERAALNAPLPDLPRLQTQPDLSMPPMPTGD